MLAKLSSQVPDKSGIPEYLMCSVQQGDLPPVFVYVVYRSSDVSFQARYNLWIKYDFSLDYTNNVVTGNPNANLLTDSFDAKIVRKLAEALLLQIVQHGSTHYTKFETHHLTHE